jgi:hypothetical protein
VPSPALLPVSVRPHPDYVLIRDEQRTVIRNFEGRTFEYPEPAMVRVRP